MSFKWLLSKRWRLSCFSDLLMRANVLSFNLSSKKGGAGSFSPSPHMRRHSVPSAQPHRGHVRTFAENVVARSRISISRRRGHYTHVPPSPVIASRLLAVCGVNGCPDDTFARISAAMGWSGSCVTTTFVFDISPPTSTSHCNLCDSSLHLANHFAVEDRVPMLADETAGRDDNTLHFLRGGHDEEHSVSPQERWA